MTDAERLAINERIALKLGWTNIPHPLRTCSVLWCPPEHPDDTRRVLGRPPDFTRKIEHTWPLLEQFLRIPGATILALSEDRWRAIWPGPIAQFQEGDTLIEVIACAYDAWGEEKK